jgi:2-oxoglutarate dehydrogenase complex dehydrogenase (E1) component-like enzyme
VFKNNSELINRPSGNYEKEKSLALSAYMLIRYYKTRGHESAELDPLRLVNFKEFGKVYVNHSLENDLKINQIYNDKDIDTPFSFPSSSLFVDQIAVQVFLLRDSYHKKMNGL